MRNLLTLAGSAWLHLLLFLGVLTGSLSAYPITITVSGTLGAPIQGSDVLRLANTAFQAQTTVDSAGPLTGLGVNFTTNATSGLLVLLFQGPPQHFSATGSTASVSPSNLTLNTTPAGLLPLVANINLPSNTLPNSVPIPIGSVAMQAGSTVSIGNTNPDVYPVSGTLYATTTSPVLSISPNPVNITFSQGNPAPVTVNVNAVSGGPSVPFTAYSGNASDFTVSNNTGYTSGAVTVTPKNLSAGSYTTTFLATSPGSLNGSALQQYSVPVNITVTPPAQTISASPSSLSFSSNGASSQNLQIATSTPGASFTVAASSTGNWLSVSPGSGTTTATVSVSANASGLQPGVYNGSVAITVAGAANSPLSVPVSLTVLPNLTATPSSISASYQIGGTQPAAKTINLGTTGVPVSYSVSNNGAAFFSVTPGSGTTPGSLSVTFNTSGLTAQTYTGSITVTSAAAGNSPLSIPVSLAVSNATPTISLSSNTAGFTYTLLGPAPAAQVINVTSQNGSVPITATVLPGASWLSAAASGSTPGTVTLSILTAGLTAGQYTGTVNVAGTGASNNPQPITVTLNVTSAPNLTAAPSSISAAYQIGQTAPPPQTINLGSTGAPLNYTVTTANATFFSVNTSPGTTPGSLTITFNTSNLTPQTYNGSVTVSSPAAGNASVSIPVQLVVSAAPVITISANTATFNYTLLGVTPPPQIINVTSQNGAVPITAAVAPGAAWLSAVPSGSTPGIVTLSINPAGLTAGAYTGTVNISGTGAANTLPVAVTLNVSGAPNLTAAPASIAATYQLGQSAPAAQTINVGSTSSALSYTVASTGSFFSVAPSSGSTPGALTVSFNTGGLSAAQSPYTGSITITAAGAGNSPFTIPVTLTVLPQVTLSSAATSGLSFNYQLLGANPPAQNFAVSSSGANVPYTATVTAGANFLSVLPGSGTTGSGSQSVTVNPGGLTPGTYNGAITVSSASASNTITIPVTFTVTSAPSFTAAPSALSFNYTQLGTAPGSQTITLGTSTSQPVSFTSAAGGSWLSVTPGSGTTPGTLNVAVNPAGLAPATYSGSIQVTGNGVTNSPFSIPVSLTVTAAPQLTLSSNGLNFSYQMLSGQTPGAQSFTVSSNGAPLTFTVNGSVSTPSGGTWLSATPGSGSTSGSNSVSVGVNPAGLAPGTYSGTISVASGQAGNSPQTVPVTFTVSAAPTLTSSTTSLTYSYQQGGTAPPAQQINVGASAGILNFTAVSSQSWLTVSGSTTTPATLTASVNPSGLPAGANNATITLSSPGASNNLTVNVTVNVTAAPTISLSQNSAAFNYTVLGTAPVPQVITVTSQNGAVPITATVLPGAAWLTAAASSGNTPGSVTLSVSPSGLTAGTYTGTVNVAGAGASNNPQTIAVTLNVTAAPVLTLSQSSVTASYQISQTAPAQQTITLGSTGAALNYTVTTSGGTFFSVTPTSGGTPGSLAVSFNTSGLTAQTYTGSIVLTAAGAGNSPVTIPVTLIVSSAPNLEVSPGSLTFNWQVGQSAPSAQPLSVSTTSGSLAFANTVTLNPSYLTVIPASGTATATSTNNVSVSLNTAALPTTAGTYQSAISVAANGQTPTVVRVVINVTAQPVLSVAPTSLSFSYQVGSSQPAAQAVAIATGGSGTFSAAASVSTPSGGTWLSVNPTSGATPGSILASINAAGLTAGNYSGAILVTAPGASGSPVSIPVTLAVTAAPNLQAAPSSLTFNYTLLSGSNPPAQTIALTSSGTPLTFTSAAATVSGGSWLTVTGSGATPNSVSVSVAPGSLTAGSYAGSVTLTSPGSGNGTLVIPVTFNVTAAPTLTTPSGPLSFSYQPGGTVPAAQSVTIASSSGTLPVTAAAATTSGGSWLSVTPGSTNSPATFSISATPGSLGPGTYNGSVTFTAAGASNTITLNATLTVSALPGLTAAPTSLTFNYQQLGATPAPQNLALSSSGASISYTAAAVTNGGGNWLVVSPGFGSTPAGLAVSINPAAITGSAATLTGSITITASNSSTPTTTIPVTLNYSTASGITLSSSSLSFSYQIGGQTQPPPQTVAVTTSGSPLNYTASASVSTPSGGSWLAVTGNGSTPGSLSISVLPAGLAAGIYSGTITIQAPGASNNPVSIPVSFTVSAAPSLIPSPASLSFLSQQNSSSAPPAQTINLTSSGFALGYTAAAQVSTPSGGVWLAVTGSGTTPGSLTVSVMPGALAPGTYSGAVVVTSATAANSPLSIPVTLTVSSAPPLTAAPTSLSFTYQQNNPSLPAAQTLNLASGSVPVGYTAAAQVASPVGGSWLNVAGSGSTPGSVSVTVTPGSLAPGTYSGSVVLTAPNASNSPVSVPVTLTVTAAPVLTLAPTSLNFNFQQSGTAPAAQTLSLSSNGFPIGYTASASVSTPSGGTWLAASGVGSTPGSISVSVTPGSLPPGSYSGQITLAAPTAGNGPSISVPVVLNVTAAPALVPSPTQLTFSYAQLNPVPAAQTITLTTGTVSNSFTVATSSAPWLAVTPVSGSTSGSPAIAALSVAVAPGSLTPGTYKATITVSAPNSSTPSVQIPVALTVTAAPSPMPNPVSLSFTATTGQSNPAAQVVAVTSNGSVQVGYSVAAITATGNWLTAVPSNGTTPGSITVSAATGSLTPGTYTGTVALTSTAAGSTPVSIPVTFTVLPAAALTAAPASLTFNYALGGGLLPPAQSVVLSNGTGAGFTVAPLPAWLLVTPLAGTTPASLNVSIAPAGLNPGAYRTTITVTSNLGQTASIPVTLNISAAATLTATPAQISFTAPAGGAAPAPQSISIGTSAGTLSYTASQTTAPWLTIVNTGVAPGTLTAAVNPTGLLAGIYNATVTLTAPNVTPLNIPVQFTVTAPPTTLTVAPAVLNFNWTTGSPLPAGLPLKVSSASPVNFAASASQPWLSVSPASAPTPGTVTVTVNPAELQPGSYYGAVTFTVPGSPATIIPVNLTVASAGKQSGITISAAPTAFSFAYQQGSANPAPANLALTSSAGSLTFAYTVTGGKWLTVTPASSLTGTATTLTVSVDASGLQPGNYNGSISTTSASSPSPVIVPVVLTVSAAPAISVSPASMTFSYAAGGPAPAPQVAQVSSTAAGAAVSATVPPSATWLTAVATGAAPGTITVTASPAGLASGEYSAPVTVTGPAGTTPQVILVSLSVNPGPAPLLSAVTNGISFAGSSVSPGLVTSFWGTNLGPATPAPLILTAQNTLATFVAGTQVFFDGIPAAIVFTSDKQVNVIAPYSLGANPTTTVQVAYQGQLSNTLSLTVQAATPAIFSQTASGSGAGAILNQDYSLNTPANPAAAGSVIQLFGGGFGQTDPVSQDAVVYTSAIPKPMLGVTATIGGVPATVAYAGGAPGLVSGITQVNLVVPPGVPSGVQPVVVTVGTFQTQSTITVAIQ